MRKQTIEDILILTAQNYNFKEVSVVSNIIAWGETLRLKIKSVNKEYFLKEKVIYLNDIEFKRKTTLHQRLTLVGAPVIPIMLSSKRLPYMIINDRLFELMPWIRGTRLRIISKDLKRFARTLAKLQIVASKNLINSFPKKIWNYPQQRQKLFPDQPKHIQNYLQFFKESKISSSFKSLFLSKIFEINKTLMRNIQWDELQISWIHGDPGLDNCIVYKDKILFFDLDNMRIGYRIWDLARICSLLGSFEVLDDANKRLSERWKLEPVETLINGFCEVINLDKFEKDSLFYLIGIQLIMNFIAEYDLDDSYDPTFKIFNLNMNHELQKLINLLEDLEIFR